MLNYFKIAFEIRKLKNMPNIITNLHVSNLLKRPRVAQLTLAGRVFETVVLKLTDNINFKNFN